MSELLYLDSSSFGRVLLCGLGSNSLLTKFIHDMMLSLRSGLSPYQYLTLGSLGTVKLVSNFRLAPSKRLLKAGRRTMKPTTTTTTPRTFAQAGGCSG
jgi:hypothetical protein